MDELYEVLVKFRDEDPNGNGIADEIPLTGATAYRSATDQWLINAFVYCVDEYAWNVTDGKLWSPYSTDEYREAMIYMNKLVSEKLLSTNVFTGDSATLKPMNTPTEGESIVGAVTCHPTLHMDENSPVIYDYTAIGPLKAAEGSKIGGYAAYYADTYRFTNVITEDCENPELAFRLLDFMSSTESARRQRYGVYGVDWTDAPEGSVTSSGTPAKVETINASVFSEQNNQCWHNVFCQVADSSVTASSYTDDGSGLAQRKGLCRLAMESYASFPVPEETFTNVAYTEEEQETINELLKIYKDYVKEARGLFATGAMDPSSDKDWNSYLEQLEARGQSKLLECAQAAYDRIK